MTDTPAYLTDELGLDEAQRAAVEHTANQVGTATAEELIASVRRNGRVDGILETALTLPLDEYRRVEEVHRAADVPDRPKVRRRR